MQRTLAVLGTLLFLVAPAAAQPANTIDANPGLISPDSTLYGLQIAFDSTLVDWGIKDAGDVAHQRASEALIAAEAGDTEALDRALQGLNVVAEKATEEHEDGLVKAEALLIEARELAPSAADTGISQALDQVQEAQDRAPEAAGDRIPRMTGWALADRLPV